MVLEIIADEELPEILKSQLLPSEKVHYFSYIAFEGGCWSSSNLREHWIALTNKRVLYKSKVIQENGLLVETDGLLPLEKVSFIEVNGWFISKTDFLNLPAIHFRSIQCGFIEL